MQIRAHLRRWNHHFLKQIMVVAERKECDVTELGIACIARGVAGRPEVYPVKPTYVVTKMPIEKTDTSAYCDHIKVNSHMERDVRSIMEN